MSISKECADAINARYIEEILYQVKGTYMLDLELIRSIDECRLDADGDISIHIKDDGYLYDTDELLIPAKRLSVVIREELDKKYQLRKKSQKLGWINQRPTIVVVGKDDIIISTHNQKYCNNVVRTRSGTKIKVSDKLFRGERYIDEFNPKNKKPWNKQGAVYGCTSPFGDNMLFRAYYDIDDVNMYKDYKNAVWHPRYTANLSFFMSLDGKKYPFVQMIPANFIVVGKTKQHR